MRLRLHGIPKENKHVNLTFRDHGPELLISAQRAFEIGLVNRVVPASELMGAAREVAEKILSRGPSAVRTAKMAMNRGLDMDLQNGCALEASLFAAGFSTADLVEGITAFLEKRKPNFTGK